MATHPHDHAEHSDYVRGQMDVNEQSSMYQNFLIATQWGCVLIAAMVACMTLIWGANVEWLVAVVSCGALAIGAGAAMKMGGAFTLTAVGFTIIGLISGGISTLVGMFS